MPQASGTPSLRAMLPQGNLTNWAGGRMRSLTREKLSFAAPDDSGFGGQEFCLVKRGFAASVAASEKSRGFLVCANRAWLSRLGEGQGGWNRLVLGRNARRIRPVDQRVIFISRRDAETRRKPHHLNHENPVNPVPKNLCLSALRLRDSA